MFVSKKLKIQDSLENQKSKYLGLAQNGQGAEYRGVGKDDLESAATSLKNYSRLAEDYGHRRYVRKAAGRVHGRRVF